MLDFDNCHSNGLKEVVMERGSGLPNDRLIYEKNNLSNNIWKIAWITNKNAYGSVGIHIWS